MPTLLSDMSIQQFQYFIKEVYEVPNNRKFELGEMLDNVQRFGMRGLKGIRKKDVEKTKRNLIISLSFFMSILNRLDINIEEEMWRRFPYVCSYCNNGPCSCKELRPEKRQQVTIENNKRPETLENFQKMFNFIYPANSRTLEHAGVHFAEEIGEVSESIWTYRSTKNEEDFEEVKLEAADYFSCILGIFNSLNIDLAKEVSILYQRNCHECKTSPCVCDYPKIRSYKI